MTEQVWTVPDVYLLTEGARRRVAVPQLTLMFLGSGLAGTRPMGSGSGAAAGTSCARWRPSIALCGAAVMAVLLLSAVHLIHF